jgi:hypothetical protein
MKCKIIDVVKEENWYLFTGEAKVSGVDNFLFFRVDPDDSFIKNSTAGTVVEIQNDFYDVFDIPKEHFERIVRKIRVEKILSE